MRPTRGLSSVVYLSLVLFSSLITLAAQANPNSSLELSRPVRTWESLPVVGTRAALLGNESGQMEAWVYPLKLFRDFHVIVHVEGHAIPAENLVRAVIVHPEAATLVYAGDSFSIRQTFFVPVHESGAFVVFEVETEQPLEIETAFTPDLQLEWPAGLGGTWLAWDERQHAFRLGEEQKKFVALVGSPLALSPSLSYQSNFSSAQESSMRLGVIPKGRGTQMIVIAASTQGATEVEAIYQRLASSYSDLLRDSAQYYRDYLDRTVNLTLPDAQLQQAYDWSRISMIQGLVTNAYLGTGLVAGYRTSGTGQRPGFAWFFGRDSFWTSFALNSVGDIDTSRTALEFVGKFQREDGKIPHEISQGASFVNWFKDYPYAYSSADATPLYIIAASDYVASSGDVDFARQKWDNLWRAYQFLRSTYDPQGFPQNSGVGHGWVEGGPLLPVKTEFYMSGLGLEALQALSNLARLVGKTDVARQLQEDFERQKPVFNQAFWSPEKKSFVFALDRENRRTDELSVLATVPMWFGLTEEDKSQSTIEVLADGDHQSDWGMRIISNRSPLYSSSGYHFGSVWPLFTGWASVAEYRYHEPLAAYANLRANALLALDGSLGHVTEVLSGDYYQSLSTSSPHQIWSAAMVVSPILRGMFGLETDSLNHALSFAPHIPAEWRSFSIDNLRVGNTTLALDYRSSKDSIALEIKRIGATDCTLDYSPSFGPRTRITKVELNGHPVQFRVTRSSTDQHVTIRVPLTQDSSTVRIHLENNFGISFTNVLPPLGSASRGLRILSEVWNSSRTQMTLSLSGSAGQKYKMFVSNPSDISSVAGGKLEDIGPDSAMLLVAFPAEVSNSYVHQNVVMNFSPRK